MGWTISEDAGRGWRRTVASPRPTAILETELIRGLLDDGAIVVAVGGGGIPVSIGPDGTVTGVEAVVDKDIASGLLAHDLGAEMLMIPTAVPRVAVGFRHSPTRSGWTPSPSARRVTTSPPANSARARWSPKSRRSRTSWPRRPDPPASSAPPRRSRDSGRHLGNPDRGRGNGSPAGQSRHRPMARCCSP